MEQFLRTLWQDESGQDMSEYALLIALIGIALVGVLVIFQGAIEDVFQGTADALAEDPVTPGG